MSEKCPNCGYCPTCGRSDTTPPQGNQQPYVTLPYIRYDKYDGTTTAAPMPLTSYTSNYAGTVTIGGGSLSFTN
jgi:hypothetical protein